MIQTNIHPGDVGNIVDELTPLSHAVERVTIDDRVRLCRQCLEGVVAVANDWAVRAADSKGCSGNPQVLAEDILSGPTVVARQLQMMIQTLTSIAAGNTPRLPGKARRLANGQLAVPVFPTSGYFDSLTFFGLRGCVRLQQGENERHGPLLERVREGVLAGTSAVLGAGNVSSIPATDTLNRIMFEGRRVVLKMNPVNEYLAPLFQRAFAPLTQANLLRIITGGADVGKQLIHHEDVDDVHVTGSTATHDAIVWGSDPAEQVSRKLANDPLLQKPVTSELGNVTPWIMVPGKYSAKQLRSQAQHVAASITNNASFNCLATKAIITWNKWEQREEFLKLVQHFLDQTPLRPAYYPGAADRYRRFSGSEVAPDDRNCLPWTLLANQHYEERPDLFREESFVCVCAETTLTAPTPAMFLENATDFVNDQMTGTLCASVTMPTGFRRPHAFVVERSLERLRYGSVCVNQWSGLAYGLISPPWGAYPGATLQNIESGIGSVHNTYLLDRVEKTVLEGPLINFPKPIWFPAHGNSVKVATHLLNLYHRPSVLRLPALFAAALRG